jgi:hypothetical protein
MSSLLRICGEDEEGIEPYRNGEVFSPVRNVNLAADLTVEPLNNPAAVHSGEHDVFAEQGFLVLESIEEYSALLENDFCNQQINSPSKFHARVLHRIMNESDWIRKDHVSSAKSKGVFAVFVQSITTLFGSFLIFGEILFTVLMKLFLTVVLAVCLVIRIVMNDIWMIIIFHKKSGFLGDINATIQDIWHH